MTHSAQGSGSGCTATAGEWDGSPKLKIDGPVPLNTRQVNICPYNARAQPVYHLQPLLLLLLHPCFNSLALSPFSSPSVFRSLPQSKWTHCPSGMHTRKYTLFLSLTDSRSPSFSSSRSLQQETRNSSSPTLWPYLAFSWTHPSVPWVLLYDTSTFIV